MYSHSDQPSSAGALRALLLCLCMLVLTISAQSQPYPVSISIAVAPPYTSHINDYLVQPNKIMATFLNTGMETQMVYIQGSITGQGGIRVYTDPSYKMPDPVMLIGGIPYMLNMDNLQEVFNADHLLYEGISKNEVLYGTGLPEGDYTICLQAFDYSTNQPVSAGEPQGCSNIFTVSNVEPPVVLQPLCGMEVNPTTPQLVNITWTRPPGTPVNTQFQLTMIEVLPGDRNIDDAMQSASHPVFYQTTVTTSSFLYGPSQPALVVGKKYAFTITAIDPSGQTYYRNNGVSEVCSFDYGHLAPTFVNNVIPTFINNNLELFENEFKKGPHTVISGKLLCKFPATASEMEFLQTPSVIRQITYDYANIGLASLGLGGSVNSNNTGVGNPLLTNNGAPTPLNEYGGPMLTTMNQKKYIFGNTEGLSDTKPLGRVWVRLVARVAQLKERTFGKEYPYSYGEAFLASGLDLNGKLRGDVIEYMNVILDVEQTGEDGSFSFNFQTPFFTGPLILGEIKRGIEQTTPGWFDGFQQVFPGTGPGTGGGLQFNQQFINSLQNMNPGDIRPGGGGVPGGGGTTGGGGQQLMNVGFDIQQSLGYICLKVEVVNPQFCSPDIDIFAMPGDVLTIPDQVAKLKTYNLTVEVKSDGRKNQLNGPNQPLAGVQVDVLRDTSDLVSEPRVILDFEGQQLTSRTTNNNGTFKEVSTGKTKVDGTLLFRNLVKHGDLNPQYWLSLMVRDSVKAITDYDYTLFNYQSQFNELPTTAETDACALDIEKSMYNHEYKGPAPVTLKYQMKPLPPEIKGRVLMAGNLENVQVNSGGSNGVKLLDQYKNIRIPDSILYGKTFDEPGKFWVPIGPGGFFRFTGLKITETSPDSAVTGPFRRAQVCIDGYKPVYIPPLTELPYLLSYGQLKDVKDINVVPAFLINGYVKDEDGKSVPSYVKTTVSPLFKTTKLLVKKSSGLPSAPEVREVFSIPASQYYNTLTVQPLASLYFPRDTAISNIYNDVVVIVYKRLHRPRFEITDQSGKPVPDVQVEVGTQHALTDARGVAAFKFASPDDQFVVRIIPPDQFTPSQEPMTIPVSAHEIKYKVKLKPSAYIAGHILESGSGAAVEGALVWSELAQTDGQFLTIQTTSDAQGQYMLKGIPDGKSRITVHVTKEGKNPSWEGVVKEVSLKDWKSGRPNDFEISRISGWDLSSLWGFPMLVEAFTPVQGSTDNAKISGYFHNPPCAPGISLRQQDLRIPFKDLSVNRLADGIVEPASGKVPTERLEILITVGQAFDANLFDLDKPAPGYNIMSGTGNMTKNKLVLTRNGFGQRAAGIRGHLLVDPASLKTASDFRGMIFLGDNLETGKAVAFVNNPVPGVSDKRYAFMLENDLRPGPMRDLHVFGFPATTVPDSSFQQGGTISLKTLLHTDITVCAGCPPLDLEIPAGSIVLNTTGMDFQNTEGRKLNFFIEKWKVTSLSPWDFRKNEESIVLPEVRIETTPGMTVKVKDLKVRATSLTEGKPQLSGGFTLGGIATMTFDPSVKSLFAYDAGIGHFRISILGDQDKPAATVAGLENTVPSTLEFKSVGLLSNNNNVLTIGKRYRFYDIMEMYVDQVMTGPNFFKLNGQPEINIPKLTAQSAVVAYTKQNSKLACIVEPIKGYIQCKGNVDFYLDEVPLSQTFEPGKFTSYGKLKVNPEPGKSGDPFYLRGLLTKKTATCGIKVITVDDQNLYSGPNPQIFKVGPNRFRVFKGTALVLSNHWAPLMYWADCQNINGLNGDASDTLQFIVHGGIDISSKSVKITQIETPVGDLSLAFDFSEPCIIGSLLLKPTGVGFAGVETASGSIRFDKNGYYMVTTGTWTLGSTGGYGGGFVTGWSSSVLQEHIKPITDGFYAGHFPDFVSEGIHGFYTILQKDLFSKEFTIIPEILTVTANAGLGVYIHTNFKDPELTLGGYAFTHVAGELGVEACHFGVCMFGLLNVEGKATPSLIELTGRGTFTLNYDACGKSGSPMFLMTLKYNTANQLEKYFDFGSGEPAGKQNVCN